MVWIIATRGTSLVIPGELVADSHVVSVKALHFIIWQYGDLGFSFIEHAMQLRMALSFLYALIQVVNCGVMTDFFVGQGLSFYALLLVRLAILFTNMDQY